MHTTYRLLNKQRIWFLADRQVLMMGAAAAGASFFLFHSIPGTVAVFAAGWCLGRIHAKDPTTLPLLKKWPKSKKAYEPKLGTPFIVNIYDDQNHIRY